MQLTITQHARQRMQQRGVQLADVEQCLERYVVRIETSRGGILYKGSPREDGRVLKVWVVPLSDVDGRSKIIKSTAWEDEDDD